MGTDEKETGMTAEQAAGHIIENLDEFKAGHADEIAKFEGLGIDPRTALAMVVTIAANAKAIADALGK